MKSIVDCGKYNRLTHLDGLLNHYLPLEPMRCVCYDKLKTEIRDWTNCVLEPQLKPPGLWTRIRKIKGYTRQLALTGKEELISHASFSACCSTGIGKNTLTTSTGRFASTVVPAGTSTFRLRPGKTQG